MCTTPKVNTTQTNVCHKQRNKNSFLYAVFEKYTKKKVFPYVFLLSFTIYMYLPYINDYVKEKVGLVRDRTCQQYKDSNGEPRFEDGVNVADERVVWLVLGIDVDPERCGGDGVHREMDIGPGIHGY